MTFVPQSPTEVKFCVFDTEGSAAPGDYKGCSVVTDNEQYFIETREEAINILKTLVDDGYSLAAHNAEYDIMVLLWPAGEHVLIEYYNHRYSIAKWYYDNGKKPVLIYDTMGLCSNLSVQALGKAIKLEKYPTPQRLLGKDPNKYEWQCEKHSEWECIECYCIRDAEIVLRYLNALSEYLRGYSIPFKRKIAGIAVSLWDRLDKHGKVNLPSGRAADIARKSYHGGRVDTFKYGKVAGVYTYDVNSMYPHIMLTCPMPDVKEIVELPKGPINHDYLQYEGAASCIVDIPYSYVPLLPVRYQDRLCFPYGRVKGTFTNAEIRAAMQRGCKVIRIDEMVYSKNNVYPFTNYISALQTQRDEFKRQADPREQVTKVLSNSLYGRLGLRGDQEFDIVEPLPQGKRLSDFPGAYADIVGERLALRTTKSISRPSPHSNVLWASQITAYARLYLLELMEQAGSHLLYCDTDSVYTDAPCMNETEGLGGLKFEGMYQRGTFIGPKLYRLEDGPTGDLVRAKGVPRNFAETYLRDGYVEYNQPGKVLEAFAQNVDPAVWRVVHKEQHLVPMKRQLLTPGALSVDGGCSDSLPIWYDADGDAFTDDTA